MPFHYEFISGYPIVVQTYAGKFDLAVLTDGFNIVTAQMRDMRGVVYMVIDVLKAETTFADMIAVLKQGDHLGERLPHLTDLRLLIVGTNELAKFYVNAARQKQFGGEQIPLFANVEDAITAAKSAYERHGQTSDAPVTM